MRAPPCPQPLPSASGLCHGSQLLLLLGAPLARGPDMPAVPGRITGCNIVGEDASEWLALLICTGLVCGLR